MSLKKTEIEDIKKFVALLNGKLEKIVTYLGGISLDILFKI